MALRMHRALILVATGSLAGLAWNQFSGHGFALTSHAYVQPGDELLEITAAKAFWDRGALFLDARESLFYNLGHVPGALSLPEPDFEAAFARLEPVLRARLEIVVYCSGFGCEASHLVARRLEAHGVPAAILHEGWPAWTGAGYPVKAGTEP